MTTTTNALTPDTLKMTSDRIALTFLEESIEDSKLKLPQRQHVNYRLARVLSCGSGQTSGRKIHIDVVPGDIVFLQVSSLQHQNCTYELRGKPVFVVNYGDLIARLLSKTAKAVSMRNVKMLGRWVLLLPYMPKESVIVMPENSIEARREFANYEIIAWSDKMDHPDAELLRAGDDVLVNRSMVYVVEDVNYRLSFVHIDHVLGVIPRQAAPAGRLLIREET